MSCLPACRREIGQPFANATTPVSLEIADFDRSIRGSCEREVSRMGFDQATDVRLNLPKDCCVGTNRVTDVWVSTTDQPEEDYTREYFSPRWTCVVGNCDVDWLRHPEYTPEAVFGEMIEIGFHSSADPINALRQFAKIDSCDWAERMLARLRCES